jgi:hypothetical protein
MYNKRQNKSKTHKKHCGGAIYSFNLNDKIGGLPARIPLNGTADGDCPATDTADLGFTNYGMTRSSGGGIRNRRVNRSRKSTRKSKSRKSIRKSRKSHNYLRK